MILGSTKPASANPLVAAKLRSSGRHRPLRLASRPLKVAGHQPGHPKDLQLRQPSVSVKVQDEARKVVAGQPNLDTELEGLIRAKAAQLEHARVDLRIAFPTKLHVRNGGRDRMR